MDINLPSKSGFMLAKEVVSVKVEKTGDDSYPTTRPEVWKFRPVSASPLPDVDLPTCILVGIVICARRT